MSEQTKDVKDADRGNYHTQENSLLGVFLLSGIKAALTGAAIYLELLWFIQDAPYQFAALGSWLVLAVIYYYFRLKKSAQKKVTAVDANKTEETKIDLPELAKSLPRREQEVIKELEERKRIPSDPRGFLGVIPFSEKRTSLGLDIGGREVRFVQLGKVKDEVFIYNFGSKEIEESDGGTEDPTIDGITALLSERGVRQQRVITLLQNEHVIIRHAEFPPMTEREVEKVLSLQGEKFTSMPAENAQVDFLIKDDVPNGSNGKMSVMIVAAPKQSVDKLVRTSRAAGLKPTTIDIESLAILRALKYLDPSYQESPTLAVINIGKQRTDLMLYEYGYPYLTRTISIGTMQFTGSLSLATAGEESVADRLVRKYGVVPDSPIWPHIGRHIQSLFDQIETGLGYYQTRAKGSLERICFIGHGARLKGLVPCFEELASEVLTRYSEDQAGSKIEVLNPEKMMQFNPNLTGPDILGPEYIPALGLALRGFERGD